ncbi:SufD family Fe-S cluster assembly protein [Mycoplasmatota bacterium]|nr:SufD family Fe-S cluster assembly protein [Mycoplasmatota bacterium]
MNIPKYIQKGNAFIALSENEVINQSKAIYKDNSFVFEQDEIVFIYLDNYAKETINLNIKENVKVKVFFISYHSRKNEIQMNINIENKALLNLYSNFIARRKTKVNLKREFNLGYNSSLILLNNITYNGQLRLDEKINLNQELANIDIDLLNVGGRDDLVYVNQQVNHKAKKTYSQIHNWLISHENAKLDYYVNGTIEKGNELSNCHQLNKGIILSKKGEIKVEPTLFIDEYNVKASHGAAIGQIDENQLFYLLSRGLSEEQARSLIISGYINPFINKIKNKSLESQLKRRISSLI